MREWREANESDELEQLRQRVQELEKENSIERNLRIGVEAGFDCANEELGRLKARIENLMLDSEQWRTDCQSYCDAMHRREAAITSLQAERDDWQDEALGSRISIETLTAEPMPVLYAISPDALILSDREFITHVSNGFPANLLPALIQAVASRLTASLPKLAA